jgi:hypothetical protein
MNQEMYMLKKVCLSSFLSILAVLIMVGCTAVPEIQPESEPDIEPAPAPFVMKPFQKEMNAEMRLSLERADEIILGVYAGSHEDERLGLVHYFEDFMSFDKTARSWGPVMKVIVQVQANELNPEIIKRKEFPVLSDLDKVGICWDLYEEVRYIYLVEGQKMLVFLQTGFDEVHNLSYRNLIDAYPETSICKAKDVFDVMIKDLQ